MKEATATALSKIMAARKQGLTAKAVMKTDRPLLGLFALFGRGFAVDVQTGCSLRTLVCERLGISEDYMTHDIQTVFLDGWAVDDVETTTVAPGAVVALSAAMPGLVGATMRRGGHYAILRGNITHGGAGDSASVKTSGTVLIKLFNQVARDLGAPFLRRGVWVEGDRFAALVTAQSPGCIASLTVDDDPVAVESFAASDWADRAVQLFVAP